MMFVCSAACSFPWSTHAALGQKAPTCVNSAIGSSWTSLESGYLILHQHPAGRLSTFTTGGCYPLSKERPVVVSACTQPPILHEAGDGLDALRADGTPEQGGQVIGRAAPGIDGEIEHREAGADRDQAADESHLHVVEAEGLAAERGASQAGGDGH